MDDTDDDFAEFGTPLEPLDEDDHSRPKPLNIEDQYAKDKHGRRRFHGAFTGGFSAGYFNTVGSAEGFQPSSFKSSKSEKGKAIIQKPEDFMDDEDMSEFGIAPSVLRAKADYQSYTSVERMYYGHQLGTKLDPSLIKSLLRPIRETVGVKLLRKMGWKQGQGVGPRVTRDEKKRISMMRKKVYGCKLQNEESDADDLDSDIDDEELKRITFAPSDYPLLLVTPKENVFGLGYKGLDRKSVLSVPVSKSESHSMNRKTISGQGFSVGALEEEDEDIYSKENMSQYDFSLDDTTQEEGSASNCVTGETLYEIFVLSSKSNITKVFQPPNVKSLKPVSTYTLSSTDKRSRKLSPSPERKSAIEEAKEIQNKARKITEKVFVPAQGIFCPFIYDPDKQARYEAYLKLIDAGKQADLNKLQPITMSEWGKEKERAEFEQAAKFYTPIIQTIEDRFTPASQPEEINDLPPPEPAPVESQEVATGEDFKAAQMSMYGPLTRHVVDWKPCSALCKRFNIPELKSDEIPVANKKAKYSFSVCLGETLDELKHKTKKNEQVSSKSSETDANKNAKECKKPGNFDLDNVPENKIDLFNSIFLDDDFEQRDTYVVSNYSASNEKEKDLNKKFELLYEDIAANAKRNTSPPRGIFENLNYDNLFKKVSRSEKILKVDNEVPGPSNSAGKDKNKTEDSDVNKIEDRDINTTEDRDINKTEDQTMGEEYYGPKLPDKKISVSRKVPFLAVPADYACWVEKPQVSEHKRKKKSKWAKFRSKHKNKSSEYVHDH